MLRLFLLLVTVVFQVVRAAGRSRSELMLENIALRQQVEVLKRNRSRPRLDDACRAFWVAMRVAWRGWAKRLVIVEPDTVVKWHRERFLRYGTELSRPNRGPGRPRIDGEIHKLISRMALENDWGAPRIHGELQKLGFTVSEATISRYMREWPESCVRCRCPRRGQDRQNPRRRRVRGVRGVRPHLDLWKDSWAPAVGAAEARADVHEVAARVIADPIKARMFCQARLLAPTSHGESCHGSDRPDAADLRMVPRSVRRVRVVLSGASLLF